MIKLENSIESDFSSSDGHRLPDDVCMCVCAVCGQIRSIWKHMNESPIQTVLYTDKRITEFGFAVKFPLISYTMTVGFDKEMVKLKLKFEYEWYQWQKWSVGRWDTDGNKRIFNTSSVAWPGVTDTVCIRFTSNVFEHFKSISIDFKWFDSEIHLNSTFKAFCTATKPKRALRG